MFKKNTPLTDLRRSPGLSKSSRVRFLQNIKKKETVRLFKPMFKKKTLLQRTYKDLQVLPFKSPPPTKYKKTSVYQISTIK